MVAVPRKASFTENHGCDEGEDNATISSSQARKTRFGNGESGGSRLKSIDDSTRLTVDSLSDTSDRECRLWRSAASQLSSIIEATDDSSKIHLYVQQYGCTPPPIFTVVISILQAGIFIYYSLAGKRHVHWLLNCAGCIVQSNRESLMIFDSVYANQIWRFGSYFLIHQGLEHILFNLCVQLFLGVPLELVHKIWRMGPLYLSGIVMGSLLHFVADKDVPLIGGSGGAYALLGAYTGNLVSGLDKIYAEKLKLATMFIAACVDFGHAVYRRHFLDLCERKSYVAHLGGLMSGLMLHGIALHQFTRPEYPKVVRYVLPGCFFLTLFILIITGSTTDNSGVQSLLSHCNVTLQHPKFLL